MRSMFPVLAVALLCGCVTPGQPVGHLTAASTADLQLAREQIDQAFASDDPVLRFQALQASKTTRDPRTLDRVRSGLRDTDPRVRHAAAMVAGELKLTAARSQLVASVDDPSDMVKVAVRFALHRMGDTSRSRDFEYLSQHRDKFVRLNVAEALGRLEEPTAVNLLRSMLRDRDIDVRLRAAEAMWRLGDQTGLDSLIAATLSERPDEQIDGLLGIASRRDRRVIHDLVGKLEPDRDGKAYPAVQLTAARALGQIGSDAGLDFAVRMTSDPDWRHRQLAAAALADIGKPAAFPALSRLLRAPEPTVRLAAAAAVLEITARQQSLTRSPGT